MEALENGTESASTELFLRNFVDFSHVIFVFLDHGLLAEVQTRLLVALNRRRQNVLQVILADFVKRFSSKHLIFFINYNCF